MAFVVPQISALRMLSSVSVILSTCYAYLYINNRIPTNTDLLTDYTGAANVDPISCFTLWDAPIATGGSAHMSAPEFTFTQNANTTQTAYGWYVSDGYTLYMAEKFSTAITLRLSGDKVKISGHIFRINQC